MKIIYMGTPEIAVAPLERLYDSPHELIAIVTQPDRPSGRGRKTIASPVKQFALSHRIPVLQPAKIRGTNFHKELASFHPDLIVVTAYGKILPAEILEIPKFGCINIHLSLLPKYRGAAPVQWAIINGDTITGVTIMQMNEEMDAGPILTQQEVEILDDDDTISLSNMLVVLGADLLLKVLDGVEETGQVKGRPQEHAQATYAPKLKKENGHLDWSLTIEQIICHIKGLYPWPCAYSFLNGRQVIFLRAEPVAQPERVIGKAQEKARPATVTGFIKGRGFAVKTGDGHLLITRLKPEGKAQMSGLDFINGGYIKLGDRFK